MTWDDALEEVQRVKSLKTTKKIERDDGLVMREFFRLDKDFRWIRAIFNS